MVNTDNIPIQVTTMKLIMDNYIRWAAAITMRIVGRGCTDYINGKRRQPPEEDLIWNHMESVVP